MYSEIKKFEEFTDDDIIGNDRVKNNQCKLISMGK